MDAFAVDPCNKVCADLGANVGGFTDCLLQRGAAKVYAIDTGYGVLAYRLRKDPRVVVLERTNALHVRLPELCNLVVIDLGWTPQRLILPHARNLIIPEGQIITLVKPHYEAPKDLLRGGVLSREDAERIFREILDVVGNWGLHVVQWIVSPLQGTGGNFEYLVLLEKTSVSSEPKG